MIHTISKQIWMDSSEYYFEFMSVHGYERTSVFTLIYVSALSVNIRYHYDDVRFLRGMRTV